MTGIKKFALAHKFRIYFFFLLTFMIIDPLPTPQYVDDFFAWVLLGVFALSPYFITQKRKMLVLSFSLIGLFALNKAIGFSESPKLLSIILSLIVLTQYFLIITCLLWYTVRQEIVSNDLIFSGLTGFFLLAIGFSFVYGVTQDLNGVSDDYDFASYIVNRVEKVRKRDVSREELSGKTTNEAVGGKRHAGQEFEYVTSSVVVEKLANDDLLYYSLSNLSTLGIGDIVPNTNFLKRLTVIESSVGTLYVAVFIGRLIGMFGLFRSRRKDEKQTS